MKLLLLWERHFSKEGPCTLPSCPPATFKCMSVCYHKGGPSPGLTSFKRSTLTYQARYKHLHLPVWVWASSPTSLGTGIFTYQSGYGHSLSSKCMRTASPQSVWAQPPLKVYGHSLTSKYIGTTSSQSIWAAHLKVRH